MEAQVVLFQSSFHVPTLTMKKSCLQRPVATKQGGTLTLGGAHIWDLALLLEGVSAENEAPVNWQTQSDVVVSMHKKTCPVVCSTQLNFGMTPKALFDFQISRAQGTALSTNC